MAYLILTVPLGSFHHSHLSLQSWFPFYSSPAGVLQLENSAS